MLNLAGILSCLLRTNADSDKKIRQSPMACIDLTGNFHAGRGENKHACRICRQIFALAEPLGCIGNTWLGDAELFRYIRGTDIPLPLMNHKNCFQIVFCGSADCHIVTSTLNGLFRQRTILPDESKIMSINKC